MKTKGIGKFILLLVIAVFAMAVSAAFALGAGGESDIQSIAVVLSDSTLDNSDIKSRLTLNENTGRYEKYSYYDVSDTENIRITVSYKSGGSTVLSGADISRFCAEHAMTFSVTDDQREGVWGEGSHTVYYNLGGFTASAEYTVVSSEIKSVTVTPIQSINPVFEVDGRFEAALDESGSVYRRFVYDLDKYDYEITLKYSDGKTITCSNHNIYEKTGYQAVFSQPDGILSAGSYKGSCTIGGASGIFDFCIEENNVKSVNLYMSDGADVLSCPDDGYYDTDLSGNKYFKYVYDRTKILADVTYTDGSKATYALGALCAALHSKLELYDTQKYSPWSSGRVTLNAKIKGVSCSLLLTVAEHEHSWGEWTVKKSATCTESGEQIRACSVCNATESRTITALGHKYTAEIIAPTHTEQGYTHYECTVCGDSYNDNYTAVIPFEKPAVEAIAGKVSVKLQWNTVDGAKSYGIWKIVDGKCYPIVKDYVHTSYVVTGLTADTEYQFLVLAYDGTSYNKFSTSDYITVSTLKSAPARPAVTIAQTGKVSVKLQWNTVEGADSYSIWKIIDGKYHPVVKGYVHTSYVVTELEPDTEYRFLVRAYNKFGYSEYTTSDFVYATTLSAE